MITIFGAGMAGLMAAQMLRRHRPLVREAQPRLPDNHGALLRFRSDAVARATGIPFRRVLVHKAVKYRGAVFTRASLREANMYAQKVTGSLAVGDRSIFSLDPVERYIAPPTFMSDLARGVNIEYASPMLRADLDGEHTIISTIPMPALMDLVEYDPDARAHFRARAIVSVRARIVGGCDLFQTIYYPEPDVPWYRASITGNLLTIEFVTDIPILSAETSRYIAMVLDDFGMDCFYYADVETKAQQYGKLLPAPSSVRHPFITYMTDRYKVYSIGRFATWRQLLLDDVVRDVELVEQMITTRSNYTAKLMRQF